MSERTPPTDRAAEQATLGAILLSATAADDIFEQLTADDFADLRHSNIYTAAATLHTRGAPIDAVTICAELTKNGTLARIGGPAYIHTLLETVPTAASGVYYAQRIKDLSGLRRIIEAGTRITQLGYQGEGEPVEIADQAETELLKATETATSTSSHTLSRRVFYFCLLAAR